jgi:hypothetical protein
MEVRLFLWKGRQKDSSLWAHTYLIFKNKEPSTFFFSKRKDSGKGVVTKYKTAVTFILALSLFYIPLLSHMRLCGLDTDTSYMLIHCKLTLQSHAAELPHATLNINDKDNGNNAALQSVYGLEKSFLS